MCSKVSIFLVYQFPRMDLVRITGGRHDTSGIAFRGRLPSPDDDPLQLFAESYGLTLSELVALIGGAHNFGSAHGKCAGYIGQWTSTPLSWFGPEGSDPSFFPDLLRDDWRWYEVCTYENNTVSYVSIEDPFADGAKEHEEEEESGAITCPMLQSRLPLICEEQAMRGCEFADGSYDLAESPCDIDQLQMRLKSDFFLKENSELEPFATEFASDPALLAEQFGRAYHKITHLGLDRCGLSGHGCTAEGTVCQDPGQPTASVCVVDSATFVLTKTGTNVLGRTPMLALFGVIVVLLLAIICLLRSKKSQQVVESKSVGTKDVSTAEFSVPQERAEHSEYTF